MYIYIIIIIGLPTTTCDAPGASSSDGDIPPCSAISRSRFFTSSMSFQTCPLPKCGMGPCKSIQTNNTVSVKIYSTQFHSHEPLSGKHGHYHKGQLESGQVPRQKGFTVVVYDYLTFVIVVVNLIGLPS